MFVFLKKDLLLFLRDIKEVLLIVLLPLILVIVLSFAMGGMFSGDDEWTIDLDVALVMEDNPEQGLKSFEDRLQQLDHLPEEEKTQLIIAAQAISPVDHLQQFLQESSKKEWLEVKELSQEEAVQQIKEDELHAMLVIPEGYTAELLGQILLDEPMEQTIELQAENVTSEVEAFYSMVQTFIDEMNMQFAIQSVGGNVEIDQAMLPQGGKEITEGLEPFTLKQYFTIAIAALFTLFLVSTVVSRIGIEKRDRTFNRIILTDVPAVHFLFGKTFTTFILAFFQLIIVFVGSHFILRVFEGKSFTFWLGLILVSVVVSIAIAGISSIFSSLMLRTRNVEKVDGALLIFILLLGTLGGGFVPIYVFPSWIQSISNWIPNGLALSVLTDWFQIEEIEVLWQPLIYLLVLGLVTFLIGVWLYPKRGEAR